MKSRAGGIGGSGLPISFPIKVGKMCGVVCDQPKNACTFVTHLLNSAHPLPLDSLNFFHLLASLLPIHMTQKLV